MKYFNKIKVGNINRFLSDLVLFICFLIPYVALKIFVKTLFSLGTLATNQIFFGFAGIIELFQPFYLLIWVLSIFIYLGTNSEMIYLLVVKLTKENV